MKNLAELVLNEVIKEVSLPDELLKFLYSLLVREEKEGFVTIWNRPTVLSREVADIYAYTLINIFRMLPAFSEAKDGLSTPIRTAIGLSRKEIDEQYSYIPIKFRPSFDRAEIQQNPLGLSPWSKLLNDLLDFRIGIEIPHSTRKLHTHIIGAPGAGKTQLIQQLITHDLKTDAAIVVIDSQKDLINKLKRSTLIPEHRLVLIDPIDSIKHPLALNMFDMGSYESRDPVAFERHINSVVEQLNFVFSAIFDSPLTDKQSVLFNYCIRLMLEHKDSTIFTLVDLLKNGPGAYQEHVAKLSDLAQTFFHTAFPPKVKGREPRSDFSHTRQEVLRRLYALLENPSVSRVFQSPKNNLNIDKEMDQGKVILISADRSLLKKAGCAFFGRYFLSLISQAMQNRANQPESGRRKAYVYVDECGDYLQTADTNVTDILEKGRKYNVGITLAHQHINQLPVEVFASVRSNTASKFAGMLSATDERQMKHEMRVDRISRIPLVFTSQIKGIGKPDIHVRPGIVENSPTRSDTEMQRIIQENRGKYCYQGSISTPEPEKEVKSDETKGIPEDPLADYT
ncbi:type IV secretion system DNA-binding domain-containing protein [Pseudomonadota bacterium]